MQISFVLGLGSSASPTQGPFYGFLENIEGFLHTTPAKQVHKERRKMWDQALNGKSLRDYEPRLNRHAYSLVSKLQEHEHEPSVRISNWVNFYSFDVMGDIGYSHKFDMLEKGKQDNLIKTLHKEMAPLSVFSHIPWALSLLMRFGGARDVLDFSAWSADILRQRKKAGLPLTIDPHREADYEPQITPKEEDIFGWLLNPEDEHVPQHLIADSKLLTVAGRYAISAISQISCLKVILRRTAIPQPQLSLGSSTNYARALLFRPNFTTPSIKSSLRKHSLMQKTSQTATTWIV
jgi:hypothetical protein